jgi:hypothetical protein
MTWWGFEIGGTGLSGQYWLLVLQVAFGVTVLVLGWVGPVFTGAILAASVFWVVRDLRRPSSPQVAVWCRANTIGLGGLIVMTPVLFGLFRFGDPSGTTDLVGVVIRIGQWMLLADALMPPSHRPPADEIE